MANLANLIFGHTFTGSLNDPWPGFSFPSGNPPFEQPRIGSGPTANEGIGSVVVGAGVWRAKSILYPGRGDYKADLQGRWKNPSGAGDKDIGLIFRFKDANNYAVARVSSGGSTGAGDRVRLFKVQAGVATQLGATYLTSAAKLLAGFKWRARVAELNDGTGNTSVRVYTDPTGATSDGDLRINWEGDLAYLRGFHTVGIELGTLVWNDDVSVDNLEVYDFEDEWTAEGPGSGVSGLGWQVELDGDLYNVDPLTGSLDGLAVRLEWVRQAYGPNGNGCYITETGDFTSGAVRPNTLVKVWHDGNMRFRGRVMRGSQGASATRESRSWTCVDAFGLARNVIILEDDGSGVHAFNLPEDDERYDPDRLGDIGFALKMHFDRYAERLREVGAAPEDGSSPYVQSELNALNGTKPSLATSNNVASAVQQMTALMPSYQVWVDPATLVWHFRNVTTLTPEVVSFGGDVVTNVVASPDPSRSFSRVRYRGAQPGRAADTTYTFGPAYGSQAGGAPAWTAEQAANFTIDKKTRTELHASITSAGFASATPGDPFYDPNAPENTLTYVTISAKDGVDPDDYKGAVVDVGGDAFQRWCLGHTSTKFYFGAPLWMGGTPPAPGNNMHLSLKHPDSLWWYSAQGVGRAILLPPAVICPSSAFGAGLKHGGFCGNATVSASDGGEGWSDEMAFKVHVASVRASQSGLDCGRPAAVLADKPKPPLSLINRFKDAMPPGGSPPTTVCEKGASNDPFQGGLSVDFSVSEREDSTPTVVVPSETTWEGCAYDQWGIEHEFVFDDPRFTDEAQVADITPIAQSILDVFGECVYTFDVTIATPWVAQPPQIPTQIDSVGRWAGLFKSVRLSSSERTTGFEASDFPMYSVTWNIPKRETVIRAGTALGWLGYDANTLTRELRDAAYEKLLGRTLQTMEDYRAKEMGKGMKSHRPTQGPSHACESLVVDNVNKRVVSVQKKFDDDQGVVAKTTAALKAVNDLLLGESTVTPGDSEGLPGVPDNFVSVDGHVGAPGRHDLAHQGIPTGVPNANTSRFNGIQGADNESFGAPSRLITKRAGLAFLTEHDATGAVIGVEAAPLTIGGAVPVGGFQRIDKPSDVKDKLGVNVIDLPHGEAIAGKLRQRTDDIAAELGNVVGDDGDILPPGAKDDSNPEGAKPSLASYLRTPGAERYFSMVPSSWNDPRGAVWYGPHVEGGADAGKYWRVMVPEHRLVEVAPGGGTFDWVVNADGSYNDMSDGSVIHKQAHGSDFEYSGESTAAPSLPDGREDDNPFGFSGNAWALPPGSAVGASIALPSGVVGVPSFTAHLREDYLSPSAPGLTHEVEIRHSYMGSAWTPATGSTGTAVVTDGSGTGVGLYQTPGGGVPPGLRSPSGRVSVSVGNTGAGTATGIPYITGIGVDVAVIQGGYLVRVHEGVDVEDAAVTNQAWNMEQGGASDAVDVMVGTDFPEAVGILDGVHVEIDP